MAKAPARPNWERAIKRALKTGSFTQKEIAAANEWRSCAVGEARERAPGVVVSIDASDPERGPADEKLRHLGGVFPVVLRDQGPENAARLYAKIQGRATELAIAKKFKIKLDD